MSENNKRKVSESEVIELDDNEDNTESECIVCSKLFPSSNIDLHVHFCLKNNQYKKRKTVGAVSSSKPHSTSTAKQQSLFNIFSQQSNTKQQEKPPSQKSEENESSTSFSLFQNKTTTSSLNVPLAEKMRPTSLDDYYGQANIVGDNTFIKKIFDSDCEFPSMLLWGPPGSGKTTLAHIIETKYKTSYPDKYKFIKMSAALSGINEVKKIFEQAKNSSKYNKKTVLFLDEIHRFNKMQQDILLSHIEKGIITLICATTENPSYNINAALLSRCRVIMLKKLETEDVLEILHRAMAELDLECLDNKDEIPLFEREDGTQQLYLETKALQWIAEVSDGDARIALGNLELANKLFSPDTKPYLSLDDIKAEVKKCHMLYDKTGEEHYNTISALHKSIRASDVNASLYWVTRMLVGGDDPRFICRRLIRAASEDIGLADSNALVVATSCLTAVQTIGMPESDCIIAQCAAYLAQAPKSRLIQNAYNACKRDIVECKGALPAVPLRLRNNPNPKIFNGLEDFDAEQGIQSCMPSGLEDKDYFVE